MTGEPGFSRLLALGGTATAAVAGAKAARLSAALRAGLPVLPGWVVPCAQASAALRAAASAVRRGDPAAARRAVLSCPLDPVLATELAAAVARLGGRVIIRSSSPLERDPRWSGAFSSIAEIGADDVVTAVRSCWAAAFGADPLARLESCGLAPEALELAVVIQPELRPVAGGTARVVPPAATERSGRAEGRRRGRPGEAGGATEASGRHRGDLEVDLEAIAGHPGALLAGWAEGASARLRVPAPQVDSPQQAARPAAPPQAAGSGLAQLIGPRVASEVASLAAWAYRLLGDDTTEWAVQDGKAWLLQSLASGAADVRRPDVPAAGPDGAIIAGERIERFATREWMPLLAAAVRARGQRLPARPAAAGTAAGRLVPCRRHERVAASCLDAILLVDRPVPALAPLLFGARGVIARTGAAGTHLAEVARSLAVPMVTGCRLQAVIGADPLHPLGPPGGSWLAAIDGTTGEVALLRG